MRRSHLACVALILCSTGCHSYQPLQLEELQPQMQVRARLTSAQAQELTDYMRGEERLIQATVLEAREESLLLLVPVARVNRGSGIETLSQRLNVPHAGLLEIELKEVDRLKSAALSAAGAALIGVILFRSLRGGSSGETGGGPGGPDDTLIPFRIPIGD